MPPACRRRRSIGISEGAPAFVIPLSPRPIRNAAAALCFTAASRAFRPVPDRRGARRLLSTISSIPGARGDSLPEVCALARDGRQLPSAGWGRKRAVGASPAAVKALMQMNSQIDISGVLCRRSELRRSSFTERGTVRWRSRAAAIVAADIPGARLPRASRRRSSLLRLGENADGHPRRDRGVPDRYRARSSPQSIGFWPRFSSPTSSARPRRRPRSATSAGATCSTPITPSLRRNLARFRGREVKTTGDGFLATFDGPARGVRCALSDRRGNRAARHRDSAPAFTPANVR